MKLNKIEYGALATLLKRTDATAAGPGLRLAVARLDPEGQHADMTKLDPQMLRQLIDLLPRGIASNVHSPILHEVRQKAKKGLLRVNRAHLDPNSWPKVYRMITKVNVLREGLQRGPNQMIMKLNPKGMAVRLGTHTWDERNSGDLVVMGRWSDITKAIADAGSGLNMQVAFDDMFAGDVSVEFDRMYGSDTVQAELKQTEKMTLFVSCETGPTWQQTDDEGKVVLDSSKELAKTGANATAGLAGNLATLGEVEELVEVAKDIYDSPLVQKPLEGAIKLKDHIKMKRAERPDKAMFSLTVGLGPVGSFAIDTGKTQLSEKEFLNYASMAHGLATAKSG